MKWFLMLIFAGGTADLVPAGQCEIECLIAIEEVTEPNMPFKWRSTIGQRRLVAASCLPFDAVQHMRTTSGERIFKRSQPPHIPKAERGPGGCA